MVYPLEKRLDRLRYRNRQAGAQVIDPYFGYETPEGIVLRGRVLAKLRRGTAHDNTGITDNMREMISLFITAEVPQVRVAAIETGIDSVSD